jgi:cysteine desulfurase
MIYLDANATEPLRAAGRAAVITALEVLGNPSSVHTAGRAARRLVEAARDQLAARFGARAQDLVFCSGATEANALAIHALGSGRQVIIGATEHEAVRAAAPDATILPVDREGVADIDALSQMLAAGGPSLVCLMLANNETGTLQPVSEAAAICRRHGALLHVDGAQAAGRTPVDLPALGAHSLALSSHKLGGPMGAGALLVVPEITELVPLIRGGGQERGRRGGTPAVPAIAGFAMAAAEAGDAARLAPLRNSIEYAAVTAGAIVCGGNAARLPNTTCLALPGIRADAQVIALDLAGIAVSAGAACSSGKVTPSHVLAAMRLGPLAGQAIRVSLPWNAAEADVAAFADAYPRMADRLRATLVSQAA